MNPNPSLVVVSLATRQIVSRTDWASFAVANGDGVALGDLTAMAEEIRTRGFAVLNDHLVIDVTPTEADAAAFMQAKAAELSEKAGGLYALVRISATKYSAKASGGVDIEATSYVDGDIHRDAKSLTDAMQASLLAMSPDIRAAELRKKAEAMLAEAAALKPAA